MKSQLGLKNSDCLYSSITREQACKVKERLKFTSELLESNGIKLENAFRGNEYFRSDLTDYSQFYLYFRGVFRGN